MQLQRRSLSAAAVRSTAARPRSSLTSHASGGVARRDDLAVLDHGVFATQVHRLQELRPCPRGPRLPDDKAGRHVGANPAPVFAR